MVLMRFFFFVKKELMIMNLTNSLVDFADCLLYYCCCIFFVLFSEECVVAWILCGQFLSFFFFFCLFITENISDIKYTYIHEATYFFAFVFSIGPSITYQDYY